MHNNLFIQRRFNVQKDHQGGNVQFSGALYIAYYFYVNGQLYVSKYALCIRVTKSEAELKQQLKH